MKLIFKVYDIHQRINNTFTWFPLEWDCHRNRWNCLPFSNKRSTFRVYILVNFVFKLILLTSAAVIIQVELKKPNLFGFLHVLTESIVVLMLLLMSVADYVVLKHVNNLIFACNWIYIADKYLKISIAEQVLICKILTFSIGSLSLLAYTSIILFTFFELDPFYNVAKYLIYKSAQDFNFLTFYQKCLFKLVCSTSYFFMAHLFLSGFLNLMLLTFSEGLYRLLQLKYLQQQKQPTAFLIHLYRQCKIVVNILRPYEYDASTLVLSIVFVMCLIFSSIFFIAFSKKLYLFLVISLALLFLTIGLLDMLFVIGCSFYKSSSKTLLQWKCGAGLKSARLFKILKSLQILAVPAGDAGIIDSEIKANYLYSLLINSTNSILTIGSTF